MNILLCVLLSLLIILSSVPHIYFVWGRKKHKMLLVQLALVSLSILLGSLTIYDFTDPSLSQLLNKLSPFHN